MAETSNLELFVLAMVQLGLETPYELKTRAGLSLGSTIPLLARLAKNGLLKASEPDQRNSRKYSVTGEGASALRHGWKEMLKPVVTDVDSVLRLSYLAWYGRDSSAAAKFLRESANELGSRVGPSKSEAARFSRAVSQPNVGPEGYRWSAPRSSPTG